MVMWHKIHGCVKRSLWCVRWVWSYSVGEGGKKNKAKGAGDAADVEEWVVCRVPTLLSSQERWCDEFGAGRPWAMCCQIRSNRSGHVFPTVCGCRSLRGYATVDDLDSCKMKFTLRVKASRSFPGFFLFFIFFPGVKGDRAPIWRLQYTHH